VVEGVEVLEDAEDVDVEPMRYGWVCGYPR